MIKLMELLFHTWAAIDVRMKDSICKYNYVKPLKDNVMGNLKNPWPNSTKQCCKTLHPQFK